MLPNTRREFEPWHSWDSMRWVAQQVQRLVIAIIAISLSVVSAASAEPYSQLFVFGDSLLDAGNTQASFGIYPGPYYWNNRFSNGPAYVESLDTGLGLPPIVRSTAGSFFARLQAGVVSTTTENDGLFFMARPTFKISQRYALLAIRRLQFELISSRRSNTLRSRWPI